MGVFMRNPYLIIILPIALMFYCDGTKTRTFANTIVSETLESCPENKICDIPLPLLPKDISACVSDNNCFAGHKCCHTPCYGYKVCQVAIKTTNGYEHGKELKDKHTQEVEDTIEKIFKDFLGNLNADKSIPINLEKKDDKQNVKINLIYNVVKKTYIHNMHIYNPIKGQPNEDSDNKGISYEILKDTETKNENPEIEIDLNLISEVEIPENHIAITEITNPETTTEILKTKTINEIIPEQIEITISKIPEIKENPYLGTVTTEENKHEIAEIIIKDTLKHEAAPIEIETKITELTISETDSSKPNVPEKITLTIPEISVKCGLDDEDCINVEVGSGFHEIDENKLEGHTSKK